MHSRSSGVESPDRALSNRRESRSAIGNKSGLWIDRQNSLSCAASPATDWCDDNADGGGVVILVVGGRSKIGSALIDELLTRNEQVRALVRPREEPGSLSSGVEASTGDLGEPDSLSRVAGRPAERVPGHRRGAMTRSRQRRE